MGKIVSLESYLTHEIPILRKLAKCLLEPKFIIIEVTFDTFGGVACYNEFSYFSIRKNKWKKPLTFGYRHFCDFYFWTEGRIYQHQFDADDLNDVIDNNQFDEFLENIYKLQHKKINIL